MIARWLGALYLLALAAGSAAAQVGLADPGPFLAFFAAHKSVPVDTAPIGPAPEAEPFAAAVNPLTLVIQAVSPADGKLSGAFVSPALVGEADRNFHGIMTEKGLLLRGPACTLSGFPAGPGLLEGFLACGQHAPLHIRIRTGPAPG